MKPSNDPTVVLLALTHAGNAKNPSLPCTSVGGGRGYRPDFFNHVTPRSSASWERPGLWADGGLWGLVSAEPPREHGDTAWAFLVRLRDGEEDARSWSVGDRRVRIFSILLTCCCCVHLPITTTGSMRHSKRLIQQFHFSFDIIDKLECYQA